MKPDLGIRWVVALPFEAQLIRNRLQISTLVSQKPYRVFRNADGQHWLVESGVGSNHAAAATMYLHQVSQAQPWTAWINAGIAAHATLPLGTPCLIHQIHQASSGQVHYPTVVFPTECTRGRLITVDRPEAECPEEAFYDMEGAAFFAIASRLSSQELAMLFKVVSDHGMGPETRIDLERLSKDFVASLDTLEPVVTALQELSSAESERLGSPPALETLLSQMHVSVSQEHQLRDVLKRWNARFPATCALTEVNHLSDCRSILEFLNHRLSSTPVQWSEA
ncbi:MAG: hypothetical protein QF752_07175 [Planctomycetota bacterium]|jgi:hypothetical protein|nr:hypothetical protein [Planctomycetota bacterium]